MNFDDVPKKGMAQEMSPIEEADQVLEKTLNQLEDEVSRLIHRIEPICNSDSTPTAESNDKRESESSSSVLQSFRRHAARVSELNRRVRQTLDRIEL